MFEEEAEESFMCKKVLYKWETDKRSYMDGFKDGYNKANEWQEQVQKATDEGYARTLQTIQLTKAKEIIKELLNLPFASDEEVFADVSTILCKAEQFLNSEVEK